MTESQRSYPDVAVHCVTVRTDVVAFLAQIARSVSTTLVNGTKSEGGARFLQSVVDGAALDQPAHRELTLVTTDEAGSGQQHNRSLTRSRGPGR
jgi:hypothetical protein